MALHDGPILLGRKYFVDAEVIALIVSPKSEAFWFDSCATDEHGS